MAQRIKGKCKYCGKEYTMSYMNRHLSTCKERQDQLAAEKGSKMCGYFELAIYPKYNRDYWLFIEVKDSFWGEPAKSMNYKLKTVLEKGMTIDYEYDFGSTTELMITVVNYRTGYWKKDNLTILSRNNPPLLICDECGSKPAVVICTECAWEGRGFLCENCAETHECGEEMMLNVCNSPRMGVCGYMGSDRYPDQFIPDPEQKSK